MANIPDPSLDIVIVNWNAGNQLRTCLRSISDTSKQGVKLQRVIIVDNGSTDDSLSGTEDYGLPITILRNPGNQGFARAANRGAWAGSSDLVLFLNPDCVLFSGSLAQPTSYMRDPLNADVGVVGIRLIDSTGEAQRTCAYFPQASSLFAESFHLDKIFRGRKRFGILMIDWDHNETRDVDHVIGAFYLIRRPLFTQLDGFDERFFVYLEDLDLSLRVRQNGRRIRFLASVTAFHYGGGLSKQVPTKRLVYALQSRIVYAYKHFGFPTATLHMMATLGVEPLMRIAFAFYRRSLKEAGVVLCAFAHIWRSTPQLVALGRRK